MPDVSISYIPETSAYRLGRHVEHDERSRGYAEPASMTIWRTVLWTRRSPILNQGQIGSCTGNATASVIATDSRSRIGIKSVNEDLAVDLYKLATTLDHFPGSYPPNDTGSSGIAAMKAAKKRGYVVGYRHAFSFNSVMSALQNGPAITGISWLTGCDSPDASGLVRYQGEVRGGHEIALVGCNVSDETVTFANSWGTDWGAEGYFHMSWTDYKIALKDQGDVTIPIWAV